MSDKINIQIQEELAYSIHIGSGIFQSILNENCLNNPAPAFLLIDERVAELYQSDIESLRSGLKGKSFLHLIPSGEQSKSMQEYQRGIDFLLNNGVTRKSTLIAIGGGVTGDLAGYISSTVMRGIPLIQVATTLLAMVDSSIGGKTGINHSTGKNLIGSFYQPEAVYCDTNFLKTLDNRDWINGLSEILKYGFIRDPEIIDTCKGILKTDSFQKPDKWNNLIRKSASIKAEIVEKDAKESGLRELLNFGHTFAHAIENFTGYDFINHGEAVFAGMMAELYLGNKMGFDADPGLLNDFKSHYKIDLTALKGNIPALIQLMKRDKKVKNKLIRSVMIVKTGHAKVMEVTDENMISDAWDFIIKQFE